MKILYLHNKENWALHNVGKLWFSNLPNNVTVDMVDYHTLNETDLQKYDYVWFCLYIYEKFKYDPNKSIVTIHDPLELFPQEINWRSKKVEPSKIELLRKFKCLNVISREIKDIMSDYGISTFQIPTTSLLPIRDRSELQSTQNCKLLSVTDNYPRKNIPLMLKIKSDVAAKRIVFDVKLGDKILPQNDYIQLLDSHDIYICTSFQEGGPLPAMDAMMRGLAILTTPVGQIQELVTDDVNGYICNTREEFIEKILFLNSNREKLQRIRFNNLEHIDKLRNNSKIYKVINKFLSKLP
jgi:glycosyltransferase involved in cell wall biosynthesis